MARGRPNARRDCGIRLGGALFAITILVNLYEINRVHLFIAGSDHYSISDQITDTLIYKDFK